jgi:drug/metabolite transporter (DMT)-like permease
VSAPRRGAGVAVLVLAGVLFGSTFLVVKDAIEKVSFVSFISVRFWVAAAVLWPIARRRPATPGEVRSGLAAGACLLAGFLLQTAGLRSTGSATSAFITYLLVVLVPIIGSVRTRRLPTAAVAAGVFLAVAGLGLLVGGGPAGGAHLLSGFGTGEWLTLASAFAFALHIVVLGEVSGRHDPVRLTLWQVLTVAAACLIPGAFSHGGYAFDASVWAAAAFCGVGATAIAFFCMVWGQRVVPGSQAALILLLEPVSAGVLGELHGDHLGLRGLTGAAVILTAVVIAELGDRRPAAVGGELALAVGDASEMDENVTSSGSVDRGDGSGQSASRAR